MLQYFLLFIIFVKSAVIYGFNENRVQNGEITPPDLFQFAAKLHTPGGYCTASVISKRHILTAAHCIYYVESRKIKYDRYQEFLDIIYHAGIHPKSEVEYDKSKLPNTTTVYVPITRKPPFEANTDIAVVEFPEDTDFGVEPVKLAKDYLEKEGDEAYIMGYGGWWEIDGKTSGGSDVLRHVKLTMIMHCFGGLQICGGNSTFRALPGDSGGPMVIFRNNQWYQIGVSAGTSTYDGRSRISSYCNFIEEVTKNEVKCESIFPESKNPNNLPLKVFEPIYKGQSTSKELFNFVVPLYNYYYNQGCTATVISKRHLLTSGFCVYRDWWAESKFIEFTEYSTYKTVTGQLFPDFRTKNVFQSSFNKNDPINATAYFPLTYVWPWTSNLAILEYPEGTDFGIKPVALAKDYVQIYLEDDVIAAGYSKYEVKKNKHIEESPPILEHSNAKIATDGTIFIENNENVKRDEGGPLMIDRNGKFYQIGVHFIEGTPNGFQSYISKECDFIEEVTKNEVKCESIAPIFEQPTTTKILPQKQELIISNPQSSNNALEIKFSFFFIVLTFICNLCILI